MQELRRDGHYYDGQHFLKDLGFLKLVLVWTDWKKLKLGDCGIGTDKTDKNLGYLIR